jgi:putative (di)nucleoside polyphosphate hydrolase
MVLDRESRVFVARRIDMPSPYWQMPQGGIDAGESPREAAMRELREEIGTDKAEIIAESKGWFKYDLPRELIPRLWGGRYRGQMQKWFALRFKGRNSDVRLHTENAEFLEWKWVAMRELPDLIIPFKRQLYRDLLAEFGHLAEA